MPVAGTACRRDGDGDGRPALSAGRLARERILVAGTVQGVGFRPFVFRLARSLGLRGRVANTGRGVAIDAEGDPEALEAFVQALRERAPRLAQVAGVTRRPAPPRGYTDFRVLPAAPAAVRPAGTHPDAAGAVLVPPDVAMCDQCRRETLDPADRRHLYPFTNCTDCGPRFTILADVPYDRRRTSMAAFQLCADCAREYEDPGDRRFHAEPGACPACGPRVRLVDRTGAPLAGEWREAFRRLVLAGGIVAVKGIGGYHLACDARNEAAVAELRRRKGRPARPFAVMCRDLEVAARYCRISPREAALLSGPEAPIVLLEKRPGAGLAEGLAPGLRSLGVMLPYTPLHLLLFSDGLDVLVMTSGNPSGLPLAAGDEEALERLAGIADAFLQHDREIVNRCDDSVARVVGGDLHLLRRARGYVPAPVRVPAAPGEPDALGTGGHQRVTFCLLQGEGAVLSQHLGDLDTAEALEAYRSALARLTAWTGCRPRAIGCDLHPGYATTRLARELSEVFGGAAVVGVQHHHAHLAACLAENGLEGEAVGVVLDGTGYGEDGAVWGFEVLSGGYGGFRRHAHLAYVPLPGGERAVRRPWVMAVSYLLACLGEDGYRLAERLFPDRAAELPLLGKLVAAGFNSPPASSCGRLFDAVSALLGVCRENTYDGQAAAELGELVLAGIEDAYPFAFRQGVLDPGPLLAGVAGDALAGADRRLVATRFHNAVAAMAVAAALAAAEEASLDRVALSGGCFQNPYLFLRVREALEGAGLKVYFHRRVPANDGGLALGQAMVARWRAASG